MENKTNTITEEQFNEAMEIVNKYKQQFYNKINEIDIEISNNPFLLQEIHTVGLSIRVLNGMRFADLKTFKDVLKLGRKGLLRYRGIGKVGVKEIENLFMKHKIDFK